jgi:hypothetical protein
MGWLSFSAPESRRRGGALAGREWGEGIWAIRPGRGRGGVLSFYFSISISFIPKPFSKPF